MSYPLQQKRRSPSKGDLELSVTESKLSRKEQLLYVIETGLLSLVKIVMSSSVQVDKIRRYQPSFPDVIFVMIFLVAIKTLLGPSVSLWTTVKPSLAYFKRNVYFFSVASFLWSGRGGWGEVEDHAVQRSARDYEVCLPQPNNA